MARLVAGLAFRRPEPWALLGTMVLVHFLFGLTEAGAYPSIARALGRWFPFRERGTAQGAIWLSSRFGGAIAPTLIGSLVVVLLRHASDPRPKILDQQPENGCVRPSARARSGLCHTVDRRSRRRRSRFWRYIPTDYRSQFRTSSSQNVGNRDGCQPQLRTSLFPTEKCAIGSHALVGFPVQGFNVRLQHCRNPS